MTLLECIQRMCRATGISVPTAAFASTSASVQQIVELANQEGRALSRRHDWQELTFEGSFTTLAAESQGTLASIIGGSQTLRKIVNGTIWNRTTQQQICGPLSRKNWQGQKALSLTGPYPQYRVRDNTLRFYPSPPAGQSCFFEYVSNCWCQAISSGAFRINVAADTDQILLNEELFMAGLEWRWLRKKGLSYAEEFASYEELVKNEIGNNATKAVLSMDGVARGPRPGVIVPIGSWNLP
jgi:hypothetical protein